MPVDTAIFRVNGVSLPIPPWPSNTTLSASILLNPVHARTLGERTELTDLHDRQRRIYLNLTILFRLLTHCQHLAFDRTYFWDFIRRHWGLNVSTQQTKHVASIYAGRRRTYLQIVRIQKKQHNLLTHLIDAWNSRDDDPPATTCPSEQDMAAEWAAVKETWLDKVQYDFRSLIAESSPPEIGAFVVGKNTPSTFQIKGGSARFLHKNQGSQEAEAEPDRQFPVTNFTAEPPIPSRSKATDDPDDLGKPEEHKRKLESETLVSAKRRCISDSPNPLQSQLQSTSGHDTVAQQGVARRQLFVPLADGDVNHNAQGVIQSDTVLHDVTAQNEHTTASNDVTFRHLEDRIEEHGRELLTLKEETKLFMESERLSREIRKAYDELTMFTASKCRDALERMEVLTTQLSALSEDVAVYRKSCEEMQHQQQIQQNQIEGHESGMNTINKDLKETNKNILLHGDRHGCCEESRKHVGTRLSKLESNLQGQNDIAVQNTMSVERRLSALETHAQDQNDKISLVGLNLEGRVEKTETATSNYRPNAEFERRIAKTEEAIAINTTLIDNCRTLVEVSKSALEQRLGTFDSRIKLLEHRFTCQATEMARENKEQATRMERVELELKRYKEAALAQQEPKPGHQYSTELADLQAQLNVLKSSLAAAARPQSIGSAETTPIRPVPQINSGGNSAPPKPEKNRPSNEAKAHTSAAASIKEE